MTETTTKLPARRPALAAGHAVSAIVPQTVEEAFRLATAIAQADMTPKAFNRDPNKIMVAMLHGMEVGLKPMASLQSIAVINGMPTIWGDGAMALVESSGFLEDFDEHFTGEGDGMVAVCIAKRKGRKTPIERTFSVAQAKRAGLWGKSVWAQYPERMLKARARAYALRDGFADALRGVQITEEYRDTITLDPTDDGTYGATPPRPTRDAGPQDSDAILQRAMDIAERDSVSMDEALALAREEAVEAGVTDIEENEGEGDAVAGAEEAQEGPATVEGEEDAPQGGQGAGEAPGAAQGAASEPGIDAFGVAPHPDVPMGDDSAPNVAVIEWPLTDAGLPDYDAWGKLYKARLAGAITRAELEAVIEVHAGKVGEYLKTRSKALSARQAIDEFVAERREVLGA